ncbi:hypothetical protein OEA41_008618 [Lepraria neglecta]|uniref:Uncharacterized protein n=1 Tax=Lepraria neglecta TaxID=209136 RepID=A0AAD9Z0B4_9LECA|nr:hypothetical protein OEA41_008618 [Lepraria neglecta]
MICHGTYHPNTSPMDSAQQQLQARNLLTYYTNCYRDHGFGILTRVNDNEKNVFITTASIEEVVASDFEDTTFGELATYFRDDPFKTVSYVPTGEHGTEAADVKMMLLEMNRDGMW